MSNPLFLLGAGFNRDVGQEVGLITLPSFNGEYKIKVDYPLVGDLAKRCFNIETLDSGVSIEEMFLKAIRNNNYKPLQILYDIIMTADYYLADRLISNKESCYYKFFMEFKNSSFLTFNYDSFVNVFLYKLEQWHPFDGYGVDVKTELEYHEHKININKKSSNLVLHLHGSLCIYTVDIELTRKPGNNTKWISLKKRPDFIFDPDSITILFSPYERIPPVIGAYEPIERRAIAPVPDKAEGLKNKFIQEVHNKAKSLLESSDILVSIGYSYNPLDKSSYEHLINHFVASSGRKILLIGPDADNIAKRLTKKFDSIEWAAINKTFKRWVEDGFICVDS